MPAIRLLVAALVPLLLVAGCLATGDGDPGASSTGTTDTVSEDVSDLRIVVIAGAGPEAGEPLPEAIISVEGDNVEAAGGNVTLADPPPGSLNITADAQGYRPANRTVAVPENDEVTLELRPEPLDVVLQGRYDCASASVIAGGDCLVLADAAARRAGLPLRPGNLTSERGALPLDLPRGWTRLDLRLVWTPANPTIEDLRLEVELRDGRDRRSRTPDLAEATGPSPLDLTLAPGAPGPNATVDEPATNGTRTPVLLKVYPPGEGRDLAGTGLLGAAIAHDQSFQLHLRLSYHSTEVTP